MSIRYRDKVTGEVLSEEDSEELNGCAEDYIESRGYEVVRERDEAEG